MAMPAVSQWEHLQLGDEGTPGTYSASNFVTIPIVEGSGRASLPTAGIATPSAGQGKGGVRAAVGRRAQYVERPIQALVQHSATGGSEPPWGMLMLGAGFTETVVSDTSVTYGFPASAPANLGLSMLEEIVGGNDTKGQGGRIDGLVFEWSEGSVLTVGGTYRGGRVETPTANAGLTTADNYAGAWAVVLDHASNPFSLAGLLFSVVSFRLTIASRVTMAQAANTASGYLAQPVLRYDQPSVMLEATVLDFDESSLAYEAKVQAGSIQSDDVITFTDGTRHITFTLRDGVAQPASRQSGAPSTATVSCHYHNDGTNEPISIALT